MATRKQTANLSAELERLLAKRKEMDVLLRNRQQELDERIKLVRQGDVKRHALFAYVKKQGLGRGDLLWVYQQLPPTRITTAHRLNKAAHATKAKHKGGKQYPPKPELVPLGKQIKALRMAKGLNYSALAKAVGVHGTMISGWEAGLWRIKPEMHAKLEKALGQALIKPRNPTANGEK